jgi:DNA repair ATPase RecN
VVVPPVEGAEPAAEAEPIAGAAGALAVARLRDIAERAIEALGAELDQEVEDTRSSLDVLGSAEARRLARGDEQAKEVHEATRASAKERLAAAKRLSDYRKKVAKQVEHDLDELMAALRVDGG